MPGLKALLDRIGFLKPAVFGHYDMNGVTALSDTARFPHLPPITVGVGLVPPPQKVFMGRPVGASAAVPGFTVRIGGSPDVTDMRARAIFDVLRRHAL